MILHLKELLQMLARQVVLHPLVVYGRPWQSVCVVIQLHILRHSASVCTTYVAYRISSKLFYTLFCAEPSSFVIHLSYMDTS